MSLRVFVDYNTVLEDERGRIFINTVVQKKLLNHLTSGLPLILYDSESMEVDAIAEFGEEDQGWYAVPDWSTRRNSPPLDPNRKPEWTDDAVLE